MFYFTFTKKYRCIYSLYIHCVICTCKHNHIRNRHIYIQCLSLYENLSSFDDLVLVFVPKIVYDAAVILWPFILFIHYFCIATALGYDGAFDNYHNFHILSLLVSLPVTLYLIFL